MYDPEDIQKAFERIDKNVEFLQNFSLVEQKRELFAFTVSLQMILEEARKYADSET